LQNGALQFGAKKSFRFNFQIRKDWQSRECFQFCYNYSFLGFVPLISPFLC